MPIPCRVLTPERIAFEGELESVLLPAHDGELGIFPGHADFLGALGVGVASLRKGGAETRMALNGGYLKVEGGVLTVLAEDAVLAADADRARAEEDLRKASSERPRERAEADARDARSAWARARLRLSR